MPRIEAVAVVDAPAAAAFAVSQTYGEVRYRWDPFVREQRLLDQAGLIEAVEVGPRERRPYRLTGAGRAAFRSWLEQEPGEEQIRYPLLLTLAFAGHLPSERVAGFVRRHRDVHEARRRGYLAQRTAAGAAGASPRDLVTLDFGIRYEGAVLDWFDHLPEDLAGARS